VTARVFDRWVHGDEFVVVDVADGSVSPLQGLKKLSLNLRAQGPKAHDRFTLNCRRWHRLRSLMRTAALELLA
jgi:hypothetical protein